MKDPKTKPVRPLVLEIDDAKDEIFGAINRMASERHIPFYLLESIVNDAARQVTELAKTERENAKRTYGAQTAEMAEREGKEDENDG